MESPEGTEVSRDIDPRTSNDMDPTMNYFPLFISFVKSSITIIFEFPSGGAVRSAPLTPMNPRCPREIRAWAANPEPPVINNPLKMSLPLRVKIPSKINSKIVITNISLFPSSTSKHPLDLPLIQGIRVPGDNDPGFPQYIFSTPTPMGFLMTFNAYYYTTTDRLTICDQRHSNEHFVMTQITSIDTHSILSFLSGSWHTGSNSLYLVDFPKLVYQQTRIQKLSGNYISSPKNPKYVQTPLVYQLHKRYE